MASGRLVAAIVWTVSVGLVAGGSYCTFTKYSDYYPYNSYQYHTYCAYDCCSTDCCSVDSISVWIIVVSVISSVVVISLIITCICCCIRRQATQGHVIQYTTTASTGQVSVVSSVSGLNMASTQFHGASGGANGLPYVLQPVGPPSYYSLQPPVGNRQESAASPPCPPARTS
ncbi:hypothetical protein C0Q70_14608 [Pomacea canaliculata]|uniref:Vesicular, overexpressed in cancer, prosurvival protein 1 n=1 Tax=Pomacea canaliculata TaxID=400727 RepID=A0A2T7NSK7_POMCA|nr:hypothetical protein C0Q70_14608 [Pomacea canaliculata]